MKLNCIIIDDEPVARKGLAEDIATIDFIDIAGMAENALQALDMIHKIMPDVIFLDIQMPKLSGLELVKMLQNPPMVVITTAYPEYAMEGYHLDAIDYLLKPIAFSRLLKACNKAKELVALKRHSFLPGEKEGDYIFIKCDGRHEKILLTDLLFVEAANNYVTLHTTAKSFLTYQTLKNMEACLPVGKFIKVHKSYIIAVDKISSINGNNITIQNHNIPISRNYKASFTQKVINRNIAKR